MGKRGGKRWCQMVLTSSTNAFLFMFSLHAKSLPPLTSEENLSIQADDFRPPAPDPAIAAVFKGNKEYTWAKPLEEAVPPPPQPQSTAAPYPASATDGSDWMCRCGFRNRGRLGVTGIGIGMSMLGPSCTFVACF